MPYKYSLKGIDKSKNEGVFRKEKAWKVPQIFLKAGFH